MGKIWIVMQREFNERVRKRSFIVTTILMPLVMVALIILPIVATTSSMRSSSAKERIIIVEDNSGIIIDRLSDAGNVKFMKADKDADEIKKSLGKEIYGYLVIGEDVVDNPTVQLYTKETAGADIESRISSQVRRIIENIKIESYEIENIREILSDINTRVSVSSFKIEDSGEEKADNKALYQSIAMIFGMLIYLIVLIYGGMVMQGVVDEKNSRVMEIIISSVKPFQLMMGKILGIASVAMIQFLIWIALIVVLGIASLNIFAPDMMAMLKNVPTEAMTGGMNIMALEALRTMTDLSYIGMLLGCFVLYFVGGYLLYASMYAAIGSAVDNAGDLQQLQMPVSMPLIIAFVIALTVVNSPNNSMAFWCSMIPFTSPVVMMARVPFGVPVWELALSLGLLYGSFIFMAWFAGRIYRVGVFMYGKKPTLGEIIKWAGYKE